MKNLTENNKAKKTDMDKMAKVNKKDKNKLANSEQEYSEMLLDYIKEEFKGA